MPATAAYTRTEMMEALQQPLQQLLQEQIGRSDRRRVDGSHLCNCVFTVKLHLRLFDLLYDLLSNFSRP